MDVKPKLKVVTIPGQGGNKGAKEAGKAKADDYTLFFTRPWSLFFMIIAYGVRTLWRRYQNGWTPAAL